MSSVRQPNATPHFTLIQGLYWMTYCILVSFSSVYLLDRGFQNTQIGLLISASSILSALIQPVAAARADKMVRFALRQVCALTALVMALAAAGLLLLPGVKLLQAALYMVMLILLQLLTPFLYSLAMDCFNNHIPLNYGLSRGFGAVTYALASATCGVMATSFGVRSLPITLLVLTGLMVPFLLYFRYGGPVGKAMPRQEALEATRDNTPFLKKYRQVPVLLIGISLLFASHNILMSFPLQIVQALGGGTQEMGNILALQCVVEIPMMALFFLLQKVGPTRLWIKIAAVSFFLHALLTWLSPNMTVLYAVQILEMTGYALYTVAAVFFVNELIDLQDRVQGQAYFAMTNTIGIVLGTSVGGILLDASGAGALLAFASLTGGAGMVILLAALRKKHPTNRNVPLSE